jgi:hypothetical protein
MTKARRLMVWQVSTEPDAMHIVVKASMKMDQWKKHIENLWIVHRSRWSTASHGNFTKGRMFISMGLKAA